jgi:LemA protein
VLWILGIAAALVALAVGLYNKLVRLRNSSESAWSDIDVQLKRRHNLIPNLVETVKGYASHEQKTFREVTEARGRAAQASGAADQSGAENALGRAIANLFAVAEAYPDLRANQNFLELQKELTSIEAAIQNARRYYNAIVRDLNTACDAFPSNLVANRFDITKKDYFEIEEPAARQVPQVDRWGCSTSRVRSRRGSRGPATTSAGPAACPFWSSSRWAACGGGTGATRAAPSRSPCATGRRRA